MYARSVQLITIVFAIRLSHASPRNFVATFATSVDANTNIGNAHGQGECCASLEQSAKPIVSRAKKSVLQIKPNSSDRITIESEEKLAINQSEVPNRPRFTLSKTTNFLTDPRKFMCSNKDELDCRNKTETFRDKIVNELKRIQSEHYTNDNTNIYHVSYAKRNSNRSSICLAYKSPIKTLRTKDNSYNNNEIKRALPKWKLFGKKGINKTESCVIVSSAGSLINSNLGEFIDLHDLVMRFNHAPVEGYVSDIGKKTTIRIVNSQVVSKDEFHFLTSPLFQDVAIAVWDPCKYNETLDNWFNKPDFDSFKNYKRFRELYPDANAHIIDPRSIWRMWESLQEFTTTNILKNPPSSGFIGLGLLLPVCDYIDFLEYIPSARLNGRCHYYDDEVNQACTFGSWHPLASEKLMVYDMNSADSFSVFQNGILRIQLKNKETCL